MKRLPMAAIGALAVAHALAANPSATVTALVQNGYGDIQVDYSLADGPAIVTVAFATNGAPVAPSATVSLDGDFGKVVSGPAGRITWRADIDIPAAKFEAGDVTATLTAFPPDNPPDWLVVTLSSNSLERVRWYASDDAIPGGILSNDEYRLTKMVMRRIRAKGVRSFMGGASPEPGFTTGNAKNELGGTTEATLDHDYYMAVFELTGAQWHELGVTEGNAGHLGTTLLYTADEARRPCTAVRYDALRGVNGSSLAAADDDPAGDPPTGSLLARARAVTGVAFDLPTEGEWEFACRAGTGYGFWNNGASITNTSDYASSTASVDLGLPGRYKFNGGMVYDAGQGAWAAPSADADVSAGAAVAGSYAPNGFGLYDMHGNVREWCRDFWSDDARSLHGALNTTYSEKAANPGYGLHVLRGGSFVQCARDCRASWREQERTNNSYSGIGARLVCPCPLVSTAE